MINHQPGTSNPDLVWLAGVIDATATITVKRVPNRNPAKPANYRAHVSFATTIRALAELAREVVGCGAVMPLTARGAGASTAWRWQAESAQAAIMLRRVRPHLRIRGAQADAAIAVQELNARRAPKTPDRLAALDEAHQRALAANHTLSNRRGRAARKKEQQS